MKTVMVFGTFDIIHPGHIHMFKQAREYGDRLVVVIARDKTIENIKKHESMYSEQERKEFLTYITLIDEVILGDEKNPYTVIEHIKPDIIALGYDQKIFVDELENTLTQYHIEAQIVRLREYNIEKHKSSMIKKYIENNT